MIASSSGSGPFRGVTRFALFCCNDDDITHDEEDKKDIVVVVVVDDDDDDDDDDALSEIVSYVFMASRYTGKPHLKNRYISNMQQGMIVELHMNLSFGTNLLPFHTILPTFHPK